MADNLAKSISPPVERPEWFGHPRGLFVLFLTEMWERFSFYGMRALLIFYFIQHFLVEKTEAYAHYAAYAALVYLGSLVGGLLADRYLGFRKAVVFGAILLTIGHSLMALDDPRPAHKFLESNGQQLQIVAGEAAGEAGEIQKFLVIRDQRLPILAETATGGREVITYADGQGQTRQLVGSLKVIRDPFTYNLLFLALSFIIVGVGFMKSNITTLVGKLYGEADTRRDRGFTIYYLGINIGAFLSASVCGYIGVAYGWSYGFGLAGIGMALGLVIFVTGARYLEGKGDAPDPVLLTQKLGFPGLTRERLVYVFGLMLVGGCAILLRSPELVTGLLNGASLLVITFLFFYLLMRVEGAARRQLMLVCIIIFSAVLSWMLMEQAPASLNVFTAHYIDLTVAGFTVPAPVLQNMQPFFLIISAIPVSFFWGSLERRRIFLSPLTKIGIGLVLMGGSFFALCLGIAVTAPAASIGLYWIALLYLMSALGELCWAPVGLSAVSELSPQAITGFLVGSWYLAASYGGKLAGWVSQMTVMPEGTPRAVEIAQYNHVYLWLGIAAVAYGLFLMAIKPLFHLKKPGLPSQPSAALEIPIG